MSTAPLPVGTTDELLLADLQSLIERHNVLDYSSTETYAINDVCVFGGLMYQSLLVGNINNEPDVATDQWLVITTPDNAISSGTQEGLDGKLNAPAMVTPAPALTNLIPIIQNGTVNEVTVANLLALATLGPNLLANSGFEVAGSPAASWAVTNKTSGSAARVSSPVYDGSYSLEIIGNASGNTAVYVSQTVPVTGGQQYQLSFACYGDGTHAPAYSIYDVTHADYIVSTTSTSNTAAAWAVETIPPITIPAGCTSVIIYVSTLNSTPSMVAYFDDVYFQQVVSSGGGSTYTPVNPLMVLPDKLYAVVGDELQVFVNSVIMSENPYAKPFNIICTKGASYPRYFDYTPIAGDTMNSPYALTFNLLDDSGANITGESAATQVYVKNSTAGPSTNKNVLLLGDSMTFNGPGNYGTYSTEFYRRLTQSGGTPAGKGYSNISLIGDLALQSYLSQSIIGNSGWTMSDYLGTTHTTNGHILAGTHGLAKGDVGSTWNDTSAQAWTITRIVDSAHVLITSLTTQTLPASGSMTWWGGVGTNRTTFTYSAMTTQPMSPFWQGGAFNLASWFSANSFTGTVDQCYLWCVMNNTGGTSGYTVAQWNASQLYADLITFATAFHAAFSTGKLTICGLPGPSTHGALGASQSYGNSYMGMLTSYANLNQSLQALADNGTYSGYMDYLGLQPQFDSEYGYYAPTATPVNTRSSVTWNLDTGGVHPGTVGYNQVADALFRHFAYHYC